MAVFLFHPQFPFTPVSSNQPIHTLRHVVPIHSFSHCCGCVKTLTCPSGMQSRARLCPSCYRCSRSCRRCTGSPGTGASGWAGRWRARSSGCSSARWNGAAWRGWSICCLPPPAPASSHWNRERERERERELERGRGRESKRVVSVWSRGKKWKRHRRHCRIIREAVGNEKFK